MTYHHPVCPFGPKYDFSRIVTKICTWMHITSLIMKIVKIVLFSPPGVVAVLFLLFQLLLSTSIDMTFITGAYDDLITTITIDQVYTGDNIFYTIQILKSQFLNKPSSIISQTVHTC